MIVEAPGHYDNCTGMFLREVKINTKKLIRTVCRMWNLDEPGSEPGSDPGSELGGGSGGESESSHESTVDESNSSNVYHVSESSASRSLENSKLCHSLSFFVVFSIICIIFPYLQ